MEKVKEIVGAFIRKDAVDIGPETVMDKSVVKGSILIHRMFAALASEGYEVKNYSAVRTFGDLMKALDHPVVAPDAAGQATSNGSSHQEPVRNGASLQVSGVGIDIESVDGFPAADDFRVDKFYTENFTQREISFCLLKPDALESFAGLFAAKEAIVKAGGGRFDGCSFLEIEITHTPTGKPEFENFQLSISHSKGMAVAVALATN